MKQLVFYLLTLIPFGSFGQGKADFNKFQIGLNVSPDYCYISIVGPNEIPKGGFTAGLNAAYNFKDDFGIEWGLQYSNKGFQTKIMNVTLIDPDPSAPSQVQFIYNLDFIDIPLKANFYISKKKNIRFFTSAGITTNVFLNAKQTNIFVYTDRTERETLNLTDNDIRKLNLTPSLSLGFDYTFNDNSQIRIEPILRYSVFKMVDFKLSGNLISTGLNISYFFGKKPTSRIFQ
jgi:hypothetical protein